MSAKIDLRHLDADNGKDFISVEILQTETDLNEVIHIYGISEDEEFVLWLDKSTAIKFAKTLRTEINKIK